MVRAYRQDGLRDISVGGVPWENPASVWNTSDGAYSIQRCDTAWDYALEGWYLAHCLGTKDYEQFSKAHVVYSLRDRLGIPHATILCVRPEEYSPYGRCWDIGSGRVFTPESSEPDLRVLQVRGRHDAIAMPIFHAIVRAWYVAHGGYIEVEIAALVRYLQREGDDDFAYHFRYLMDERDNAFTWAHWNEKMRILALLEGTSL